jgi:hypothetical protein
MFVGDSLAVFNAHRRRFEAEAAAAKEREELAVRITHHECELRRLKERIAPRETTALVREIDHALEGTAPQPESGPEQQVLNFARSACVAAVLLLATFAAQAAPKPPREFFVLVGQGLRPADASNVVSQSRRFVSETCRPGDRVVWFDSAELKPIATVLVPEGQPLRRLNLPEVGKQMKALRTAVFAPSTWPPELTGQLELPKALEEVARRFRPGADHAIILIGSPLFQSRSTGEQAYTMTTSNGLVPGPGLIAVTRAESIFGCADRSGQLQGASVHWATLDESWPRSSRHRDRTIAFWTSFLKGQAATLATINSDLASAFDRAARGERRPVMEVTVDPANTALAMLRIPDPVLVDTNRPENILVSVENERTAHGAMPRSVPLLGGETARPSQRVIDQLQGTLDRVLLKRTNGIDFAAAWTGDGCPERTDIDLFVRPRPGSDEIWWSRPKGPEGRLIRDRRSSSSSVSDARAESGWNQTWELLELDHTDLHQAELSLNVFAACGPVDGVLRVRWQDRIEDRAFRFDPFADGGPGASSRDNARLWKRVDLREIFPEAFPAE